MALIDDLNHAARTGGQEAAVAIVEGRAGAGDPDALFMLGQWRLWGAFGGQDLAAGYRHIAAAAARGNLDAAMVAASLLATGTGTPRDPDAAHAGIVAIAPRAALARQHLDILSRAPAAHPPVQVLRADPYIARIDGLLTAEECLYVIALATPKVQPSTVIDPRSGAQIPNPIRTSHGTNFAPSEEDMVLHAINRRIAAVTNTRWEQGEPLHVLRYTPGQEYRRHMDALPGVVNQRILTVLVYLNGDFTGGETEFGGDLRVRGGVGDAVVFANVTAAGHADPRTDHAGLPVMAGVKWLATRWIRARRTHPWEAATLA